MIIAPLAGIPDKGEQNSAYRPALIHLSIKAERPPEVGLSAWKLSHKAESIFLVLLQFSWRRGTKDSSGQGFKGLFSNDVISAFNILSIAAMSFLSVPHSPFLIKSKSHAHKICLQFANRAIRCNPLAFHLNPRTPDPLNPLGFNYN